MQDDLIARIEAAEGPDDGLDREIFCAMFGWDMPLRGASYTEWFAEGQPAYTSSLDRAMTLIPEGANTSLAMQDRHSHRWRWELRHGFGVRYSTWAGTAPLALCAVALRARGIRGGVND